MEGLGVGSPLGLVLGVGLEVGLGVGSPLGLVLVAWRVHGDRCEAVGDGPVGVKVRVRARARARARVRVRARVRARVGVRARVRVVDKGVLCAYPNPREG